MFKIKKEIQIYRAKKVSDNNWIVGQYLYNYSNNKHYIIPNKKDSFKINNWGEGLIFPYEIDINTLGKYICQDIDGNPIFEDDIVSQTYEYIDEDKEFVGEYIGAVKITSRGNTIRNPLNINYDTSEVVKCTYYKPLVKKRAKVIGNLHDNPMWEIEEEKKLMNF